MRKDLSMHPIYEHRQFGLVILLLLLVPTLGFGAVMLAVAPRAALLPVLLILLFMLLTALVFSSLTVRVDRLQVSLHFGPGFPRRSIPLQAITGVQVVRNPAWMGLGIHFFRGGMIYNVSGRDGVEIRLETGRRVRVGSDEPAELARAVEEAKRLGTRQG